MSSQPHRHKQDSQRNERAKQEPPRMAWRHPRGSVETSGVSIHRIRNNETHSS